MVSGTIRENLRWAKPDATDEELWAALKTAQAESFVEALPQKLETRVEQGGKNFSGGQKQRLTIARALVGKPSILILDDSTSAVDTATERAIREALHSEYKDMTKIIIAQLIRSVMDADEILVLDNGKTAGFGTHEQLLADCPVYREIYDVQNGREE